MPVTQAADETGMSETSSLTVGQVQSSSEDAEENGGIMVSVFNLFQVIDEPRDLSVALSRNLIRKA
jgi:hypothetical protein